MLCLLACVKLVLHRERELATRTCVHTHTEGVQSDLQDYLSISTLCWEQTGKKAPGGYYKN